jgi:hypothetical protein
MPETNDDLESLSLDLLADARRELGDALNALGGKVAEGLLENYRFYSSVHINRAADGYLCLRKSGKIDASKLLVRPAIEVAIQLVAIKAKPEALYQIAFDEFQKEKIWAGSLAADSAEAIAGIEKQWADFKLAYREKFPTHAVVEKRPKLRELAKYAGMERYYDTHYRLYCRFTHASLRATTGDLDRFASEDNRTMAICVIAAIESVSSIGAPASNLSSLMDRFSRLG